MTQLSNRDLETGIRYGVIPFNDLYNNAETFFEGAEDLDWEAHVDKIRKDIRNAIADIIREEAGIDDDATIDEAAEEAFLAIEERMIDGYKNDTPRLQYVDDEYTIDKLDETDLFVAKSPYFTFAPECSPCAPGACYLRDGITEAKGARQEYGAGQFVEFATMNGKELHKTYCLGHDWFDGEVAPYAVYSVETGKLLLP